MAWQAGVRPAVGRRVAGFDAAVAALVVAVSVLDAALASGGQPGTRPMDAAGYGLVVVAGLVLAVRRRAPVVMLAVVAAAFVVFTVVNFPGGPMVAPVLVALYTAGTVLARRAALAIGGVTVVIVVARSVDTAVHGQVTAFTWAGPGW